MAYVGSYINELSQFGKKSYELVLTDPSGVLKEIRINKSFNEDITAEKKQIEMDKEITYYTENQPDVKPLVGVE